MSDPWDWAGGNYGPASNAGEAGTPRMGITTSDRRTGGPIVVRTRRSPGTFPDLPRGPWTGPQPPSLVPRPDPGLIPDSARRMLTAHGANGIIPVIFGGPLGTGGLVVYIKDSGGYVYVDFLVCEGPIEAITDIKVGGRTVAELGLASGTDYNVHLGTAGDTTDALIQAVEASYVVPEYTARVSFRFPRPNQTTGNYNPLDFECTVKGMRCYDPRTGTTPSTATTNPILHIHEALTNTRWGSGKPLARMHAASFSQAANDCDVDIDPGAGTTKRWEASIKLDRDAPSQSVIDLLRIHCAGNVVFGDQWKAYLDIARAATGIVLKDADASIDNVNCERIRFETAGIDEVPTVVVVDFTDASDGYKDASVQYPDPTPAGEYREQRFSCRGWMTAERARRGAKYLYNRLQLDKKIVTETLQTGLQLEPGDRIENFSRRLKSSGNEDVTVVDIRLLEDRMLVFEELYRAATYSDTIDTAGPPAAPPTPDAYATPPDPTGVTAPATNETEYGHLYFTPPTGTGSNLIEYYEVLDLEGNPVDPIVIAQIDRSAPLTLDGKIHTYLPGAIHGTVATGRRFRVKVRSVSFQQRRSTGVTVNWSIASILQPHVKMVYGKAAFLTSSDAVSWANARNAASADSVTADAILARDEQAGGTWTVNRSALSFSTAGVLPIDKTITKVEVLIQPTFDSGRSVTGHIVNVVTSGLNPYPHAVGDFDNFGSTSYGSRAFGAADFGAYIPITLAAGSYGDISDTGKTYFGLRTAGDLNDVEPANGDLSNSLAADGSITVEPGPLLVITYTSASEDAETQIGEYFNVQAYGAVGTDDAVNNDDRTFIQNALNAAEAAGGGTVFFPKGTYWVSNIPTGSGDAALLIPSNVRLLGVGRGSVIRLKARASTEQVWPILRAKSVNLSSLGGAHSTDPAPSVVDSNIVIEALAFDGNKSGHVAPAGASDGSASAIYLSRVGGARVTNCYISNCYASGALTFEYLQGGIATFNTFEGNRKAALYAAGCEDVVLGKNTSLFDGAGIVLAATWNSVVSNNTIYGWGSYGIAGIGLTGDSRHNTVSANTITRGSGSAHAGIHLGSRLVGNPTVHGVNYGDQAGGSGVEGPYGASYNVIIGNTVRGNAGVGILIGGIQAAGTPPTNWPICDHNIVSGNHVIGNENHGVILGAAQFNMVRGNFILNNGTKGVQVVSQTSGFDRKATDNRIDDNEIADRLIDEPGSNTTVVEVRVTTAGSGYSSPPSVTFSAPPSGTTATGYAILDTAGGVAAIVITHPGSGYTSAPTITFGSGSAAATAHMATHLTATQTTAISEEGTGSDRNEFVGNRTTGTVTLLGAATKFIPREAPSVRVRHSTTQSLTDATPTALNFDTERFDNDVMHDNSTNNTRLTAKTGGVYMIGANVEFAANATGTRNVSLRVNGSAALEIAAAWAIANGSSRVTRLNVSTAYRLAINDYVEVMAFQDSGGSLNSVNTVAHSPEFWMQWVGP